MSRTALIVIAVILWLAGALLLTFGDETGLKVLGAILFAAGIAAGHWGVLRQNGRAQRPSR
jgi:cytochrome c oxidase assembly factor CtaG